MATFNGYLDKLPEGIIHSYPSIIPVHHPGMKNHRKKQIKPPFSHGFSHAFPMVPRDPPGLPGIQGTMGGGRCTEGAFLHGSRGLVGQLHQLRGDLRHRAVGRHVADHLHRVVAEDLGETDLVGG